MEYDTFILEEAARTVYERPEQHGEPEDTFATIARFWNSHLESLGLPAEVLDETDVAKMFIEMKIARSLEGHYDDDNPCDVAGYAENWARLEEEKRRKKKVEESNNAGIAKPVWGMWEDGVITTEERREALINLGIISPDDE